MRETDSRSMHIIIGNLDAKELRPAGHTCECPVGSVHVRGSMASHFGARRPRWMLSPSSMISPETAAVLRSSSRWVQRVLIGHGELRFGRTRDLAETPVDSALRRARFPKAPLPTGLSALTPECRLLSGDFFLYFFRKQHDPKISSGRLRAGVGPVGGGEKAGELPRRGRP